MIQTLTTYVIPSPFNSYCSCTVTSTYISIIAFKVIIYYHSDVIERGCTLSSPNFPILNSVERSLVYHHSDSPVRIFMLKRVREGINENMYGNIIEEGWLPNLEVNKKYIITYILFHWGYFIEVHVVLVYPWILLFLLCKKNNESLNIRLD